MYCGGGSNSLGGMDGNKVVETVRSRRKRKKSFKPGRKERLKTTKTKLEEIIKEERFEKQVVK